MSKSETRRKTIQKPDIKVPNQKDCPECVTIKIGEPRCRWCLTKIYVDAVFKLQKEIDMLRAENQHFRDLTSYE